MKKENLNLEEKINNVYSELEKDLFETVKKINGGYVDSITNTDTDTDNLLPPQYLYSKDLVIDSKITEEYWYLKSIKPSRSYLIEIDNYNENVCDYIRFDDMISGIYAEMDEDNYFNWENVIDGSFVEQNEKCNPLLR